MSNFLLSLSTYLAELSDDISGKCPINVNDVHSYIRGNLRLNRKVKCQRLLLRCFDKLMRQLESEECRDKNLIANVMAVGHLMYHGDFCGGCTGHLLDLLSNMYIAGERSLFYNVFTTSVMSDNLDVPTNSDLVYAATVNGNERFLLSLVKFGAILLKPKYGILEKANTEDVINWLFCWHPSLIFSSPSIDERLDNLDPTLRSRLFLVTRGLRALANIYRCRPEWPNTTARIKNYVNCLRLAFDSIPVPVISSTEVRNYLEYLVNGLISNEVIEEVVDLYVYYFPESQEPVTPRSLQHLCRCEVRENLRKYGNLPYDIEFLPVPKEIKNYLRITVKRKVSIATYQML